MNLFFRIAADIVVVVHFAFVIFVVGGLLAILVGWLRGWRWTRNMTFRWLHLLAILVIVAEALCGITCPLTSWEKSLRLRAGDATYQGDFIAAWAHELLFYDAEPWVFTTGYCLFGLVVVLTFWLAPPTRQRDDSAVEVNG